MWGNPFSLLGNEIECVTLCKAEHQWVVCLHLWHQSQDHTAALAQRNLLGFKIQEIGVNDWGMLSGCAGMWLGRPGLCWSWALCKRCKAQNKKNFYRYINQQSQRKWSPTMSKAGKPVTTGEEKTEALNNISASVFTGNTSWVEQSQDKDEGSKVPHAVNEDKVLWPPEELEHTQVCRTWFQSPEGVDWCNC